MGSRCRPPAAVAAAVAVLSAFAMGAVPPRLPPTDLAAGRMLVATRQVEGPVFGQSIVLLTDHDAAKGAVGLIINRPSRHSLAAIVPDLEDAKLARTPVHLGGPVSLEIVQIAWRTDETPVGARRILADVHTSASADVLEALVRADTPADAVRAYMGYSGWAPGQLENEIARGDWIVLRGDPDLVFHPAPETLWPRLVGAHEGLQADAEPRRVQRFAGGISTWIPVRPPLTP